MKSIGFNTQLKSGHKEYAAKTEQITSIQPRKSVAEVYFPSRNMTLAYYNDSFDLKTGDLVYVEGKLEGNIGQVREINYSFKIKISDYKKIIAVIDTDIKGDLYFADSHLVTFQINTMPPPKIKTWFKAPVEDEEYVISTDNTKKFTLDDLGGMNVSDEIAKRGHEYYIDNKVRYVCIDKNRGYAIVEGSEPYEVEFDYHEGEISNLVCSCFCSFTCKHQFAAMLQLRETLEAVAANYKNEQTDCFAAISKDTFIKMVMYKKDTGKISLGN